MFSSDLRYSKFTDCGSCPEYRKHIFKYRSYPKGIIIPRERCLQNTLYFLLKGSVWVNSEEHPDTTFHEGHLFCNRSVQKLNSKYLKPPNVFSICSSDRSMSAMNVLVKEQVLQKLHVLNRS